MKKEVRQKVYEKYGGHCAYCGKEITFQEMQVDHYIPKRLEYQTIIDIDSLENLMPSCRRCNHYKRALLPGNFKTRIQTLHKRLMEIYIVKIAVDYGIIKINPFNGFYYESLINKNSKNETRIKNSCH